MQEHHNGWYMYRLLLSLHLGKWKMKQRVFWMWPFWQYEHGWMLFLVSISVQDEDMIFCFKFVHTVVVTSSIWSWKRIKLGSFAPYPVYFVFLPFLFVNNLLMILVCSNWGRVQFHTWANWHPNYILILCFASKRWNKQVLQNAVMHNDSPWRFHLEIKGEVCDCTQPRPFSMCWLSEFYWCCCWVCCYEINLLVYLSVFSWVWIDNRFRYHTWRTVS